eukprot:TRINITY_DN66072_c0_g1_i1.p1 TRINITY_DN66072_c0_g1~~TRINITY_DN66072_c0_g1_i1.p1  ORF type:complete len:195 (+),score=71.27 TRINITY_DN66072_c0_g1_i1:77-661(+)
MLAPCVACKDSCGSVCDTCGECGQGIKHFILPENGVSRIFVIFACCVSLGIIVVSAQGLTAGNCDGSSTQWLLGAVALAIFNAAGSIWVHLRFVRLISKDQGSKCHLAKQFILYDLGVFVYLVLYICIIVFLSKSKHVHDTCAKANDALDTMHSLWTAFLIIAPCLVLMSICCINLKKVRDYAAKHPADYGSVA